MHSRNRKVEAMISKFLLIFLLTLPSIVSAQNDKKEDVWQPLRFLEGNWVGHGDGVNGKSELTQDYEFVLRDKFLQLKTRSVFMPQEKNTKGEVHEDIAIFSYDSFRETFVIRAFYVEGFVIAYVLAETSEDGTVMTFESEAVENGPPGTSAKLIFEKTSENELEQKFYVAFPGQELSCFITNKLVKK